MTTEGRIDPIAERLIEARSKFDHTNAQTQFNVQGYRKRRMWKGYHHKCDHASGLCDARDGWILRPDDAEDTKSYSIVRLIIDMNAETRAMGGITVEYPPDLEMDPEPLHRAKGWIPEREVKDADKIRPTPRVIAELLRRHEHGLRGEAAYGGQGVVLNTADGNARKITAITLFRAQCRDLRIAAGLEAPTVPVNDTAGKKASKA